jgi:sugar (pentulose or hexulose) kinase
MGVLNPFLAVLPLMKEGKEEDSPCQQMIAEATKATKETKARQEAATAKAAAAGGSKPKEKEKEKETDKDRQREQRGAPAAASQ